MRFWFLFIRHSLCLPFGSKSYRLFYPLEILSWASEFFLYFFLGMHPLVILTLLSFRVAILPTSLLGAFCHLITFFIFQRYYDISNSGYVKIINTLMQEITSDTLNLRNYRQVVKRIKDEIFKEILSSETDPNELIKAFYRSSFKEDFRSALFTYLKNTPSLNPFSSIFKNVETIFISWQHNKVPLTKEEREIIKKLATGTFLLENDEKVPRFLKLIESFNVNYLDYPQLGLSLKTFKSQNVSLYSSSFSQSRHINWLERHFIRQDPHFNNFCFATTFFSETKTLEESFKLLFKKKKKLKAWWISHILNQESESQKINFINYTTLISLWDLNYDLVLTHLQDPKFRAPLIIIYNYNLTDLKEFGRMLRNHYEDERILELMRRAQSRTFFDTVKMALNYQKENLTVAWPKKIKSFDELHDFLQLHLEFSPKFNQTLPQEPLRQLHLEKFENFEVIIPATRRELFALGVSLKICVGASENYYNEIIRKNSYILALRERGEYRYCVQVSGGNYLVIQASTFNNQKMDYSLRKRLEEFMQNKLLKYS